MFQDEGRFGLLGRPRRCWTPRQVRPTVGARTQRKFVYAFAAVSPHDGVMDSLVLPWANAVKHVFVAIRYNHVRTEDRFSKSWYARHARR